MSAPEEKRNQESVPEGLWSKCPKCGEMLYRPELEQALYVCTHCGSHHRLSADDRVAITADEGTFAERDAGLTSSNPLGFPGYEELMAEDRARAGVSESMVWGEGEIEGEPCVLAVMDFHYRGGSMGAVLGEKFARAAERAVERRAPLVLFACSGGARMQEGIVSLLQMAKTAAVVGFMRREGIPFVVVGTDPLTAGVLASFASLGDVIVAEQGALIGFTGPRVIESAFKIKLPPGSHTAEFQYQHGMIDLTAARRELRPLLARLLRLLRPAQEARAE